MKSRSDANKPKDVRMKATLAIWLCAMLMFIISIIPLTESPLLSPIPPGFDIPEAVNLFIPLLFALPMVIVMATALSTCAVWGVFGNRTQPLETSDLEERVANLETIVSIEELDLKTKIQQLRSQSR